MALEFCFHLPVWAAALRDLDLGGITVSTVDIPMQCQGTIFRDRGSLLFMGARSTPWLMDQPP